MNSTLVVEDTTLAQSFAAQHLQASPPPLTALNLDEIYRTYHRGVYRQCYRMVRNPSDAEDLTQEVFLRVFQKAHTFRGEARFSTWLHRLTFNLVLMELRKHYRRPGVSLPLGGPSGPNDDSVGGTDLERTLPGCTPSIFERASLNQALAQLPPGYRSIFVLHDVEGYKHGEIARLRGISTGTVKSQLHKARYRLRELLGDYRDQPLPSLDALSHGRGITRGGGILSSGQLAAA